MILLSAVPAAAAMSLTERSEVQSFISSMVEKHGFEAEQLGDVFRRAEISQSILKAIAKPAEALPWHKYQRIFIEPDRVRRGVEFWREHAAELKRAEDAYGVSPAIIVAIIGVETRYGKTQGNYKVIDSLSTLAFDYPKRSAFFMGELEQYLLLAREQNFDPHDLKGSYAGAMGIPQFISSSFRRYAVDFDVDGTTDIWANPVDAIGSVANYFREHGWLSGGLVTLPVEAPAEGVDALLSQDLKPVIPAQRFEEAGVRAPIKVPPEEVARLLPLDGEHEKEYWLSFWNFYVITRYNHSPLYAMAVWQLSEQVRQEYEGGAHAAGLP